MRDVRRVLVSGSRGWEDRKVVFDALWELAEAHTPPPLVLIHGDCRGADKIAHAAAVVMGGWEIEPYPADWRKYGKAAGRIRNKVMIETRPDIVVAFQRNRSTGTQHVIDMANELHIPVLHYEQVDTVLSAKGGDRL